MIKAGPRERCYEQGWYLQLDIRNFFNTIHKPTLFRLLQHRLRKAVRRGKARQNNATQPCGRGLQPRPAMPEPTPKIAAASRPHEDVTPGDPRSMTEAEAIACRDLCHLLLKQNPDTALRLGDPRRFDLVPSHKRLGQAGPERGLPIGNLTSQFFANVYLNELDQFVKHTLKCRHYLRYVDDFILLHESPERLQAWEGQIEDFLRDKLRLELKAERKLRPVSDGADFLGYIVRPDYLLVRRRVVGNLREKLRGFERKFLGQIRGSRRKALGAAKEMPSSRDGISESAEGRPNGGSGLQPRLPRREQGRGSPLAVANRSHSDSSPPVAAAPHSPRGLARHPGQLSGPLPARPPSPADGGPVRRVPLADCAVSFRSRYLAPDPPVGTPRRGDRRL